MLYYTYIYTYLYTTRYTYNLYTAGKVLRYIYGGHDPHRLCQEFVQVSSFPTYKLTQTQFCDVWENSLMDMNGLSQKVKYRDDVRVRRGGRNTFGRLSVGLGVRQKF